MVHQSSKEETTVGDKRSSHPNLNSPLRETSSHGDRPSGFPAAVTVRRLLFGSCRTGFRLGLVLLVIQPMLLILLALLLLQVLQQHFPATLAGGKTPSTGLEGTEGGSTEVHHEVIGLQGSSRIAIEPWRSPEIWISIRERSTSRDEFHAEVVVLGGDLRGSDRPVRWEPGPKWSLL